MQFEKPLEFEELAVETKFDRTIAKIVELRQYLSAQQFQVNTLTERDWQKHDELLGELLNSYENLEPRQMCRADRNLNTEGEARMMMQQIAKDVVSRRPY